MLDTVKINDLMNQQRLTNKQLADAVGISEAMMCYIRQGKRKNPALETVVQIADTLGVTVDELLRGGE